MLLVAAVAALVAAVLAYGWSGVGLASGAREDGGALRSKAWWWGTALQGVGFATALLARTALPLLLVQSAIAGALAVTALLEHLSGARRLRAAGAWAVAAVVAGVAALAIAVQPGPTRAPTWVDLGVLLGCLAAAGVVTPFAASPRALGLTSGVAFGCGAVAARLLVGGGQPLTELVRFWQWSPTAWVAALLMPVGIVIGQWALTRGLARGPSVAALGGDYLAATLLPSAFGLLVLGESLRPGLAVVAIAGLALALLGIERLLVEG